jgi:hypothetical protein
MTQIQTAIEALTAVSILRDALRRLIDTPHSYSSGNEYAAECQRKRDYDNAEKALVDTAALAPVALPDALPELPTEGEGGHRISSSTGRHEHYSARQMTAYAQAAILADRARQSAEPVRNIEDTQAYQMGHAAGFVDCERSIARKASAEPVRGASLANMISNAIHGYGCMLEDHVGVVDAIEKAVAAHIAQRAAIQPAGAGMGLMRILREVRDIYADAPLGVQVVDYIAGIVSNLGAQQEAKAEGVSAERRAELNARILARGDEDHMIVPPAAPSSATSAPSPEENCRLRLCRRDDAHTEGCTTYAAPIADEAPAPQHRANIEISQTLHRDAPAPASIEDAAKAVYRLFLGADEHPWVDGGNSHQQTDARRYARAALDARSPVAPAVKAKPKPGPDDLLHMEIDKQIANVETLKKQRADRRREDTAVAIERRHGERRKFMD